LKRKLGEKEHSPYDTSIDAEKGEENDESALTRREKKLECLLHGTKRRDLGNKSEAGVNSLLLPAEVNVARGNKD